MSSILGMLGSCHDSDFESSNVSLKENKADGVDPNSKDLNYCIRKNEEKNSMVFGRLSQVNFSLKASFGHLGGPQIHRSVDYLSVDYNSVKYLGILVDSTLTWKPHVTELSKKLATTSGIFFKIRHHVSHETLRLLYYSLFYSFISYGICVGSDPPNCS